MGGGSHGRGDRKARARLYAAAGGTFLCLLGLAGFVANAGFATGDAIPPGSVGPVEINGWQATLYLAAGLIGLALAHPVPRLYCLCAAVVWTLLTGFGFFGAHGGEPIPSMGDRLLATTSSNVIALALAALGWLALATSRKDGKVPREKSPSSAIGRPRTPSRPRRTRDPIN